MELFNEMIRSNMPINIFYILSEVREGFFQTQTFHAGLVKLVGPDIKLQHVTWFYMVPRMNVRA